MASRSRTVTPADSSAARTSSGVPAWWSWLPSTATIGTSTSESTDIRHADLVDGSATRQVARQQQHVGIVEGHRQALVHQVSADVEVADGGDAHEPRHDTSSWSAGTVGSVTESSSHTT